MNTRIKPTGGTMLAFVATKDVTLQDIAQQAPAFELWDDGDEVPITIHCESRPENLAIGQTAKRGGWTVILKSWSWYECRDESKLEAELVIYRTIPQSITCRKCGGRMEPGIAYVPGRGLGNPPEQPRPGESYTITTGGLSGAPSQCMKCVDCGHSFG